MEFTAMDSMARLDEADLSRTGDWDARDRRSWVVVGAVCALIIGFVDESAVSSLTWLAVSVFFAYYGMPIIWRVARKVVGPNCHLLVQAAVGWAVVPGPIIGSLAGALSPWIWDLPISSFAGALLGLVVGPLAAAVEGVVLVAGLIYVGGVPLGDSSSDESGYRISLDDSTFDEPCDAPARSRWGGGSR